MQRATLHTLDNVHYVYNCDSRSPSHAPAWEYWAKQLSLSICHRHYANDPRRTTRVRLLHIQHTPSCIMDIERDKATWSVQLYDSLCQDEAGWTALTRMYCNCTARLMWSIFHTHLLPSCEPDGVCDGLTPGSNDGKPDNPLSFRKPLSTVTLRPKAAIIM